MAKKTPTRTVRKRTITDEMQEVKEKSGLPSLLKRYLLDDLAETDDPSELANFQYRIKVAKRKNDGRFVTISGRLYDNIDTIREELSSRYGDAAFRLFVEVFDGEEKLHFVRVENFLTEYDGSDEPPEAEAVVETVNGDAITLQMQREQHAHEMRMAELQSRDAIVLAAINSKGGGGMKTGDFVEIFKLGMGLNSGGAGVDGVDGDESFMDNPIVKVLAPVISKLIEQQMTHTPPAAPVPPAAPEQDNVVVFPQRIDDRR